MSDMADQLTDSAVIDLMSGPELKAKISFHEMFFLFARISAARSKDPRTQCGACIVKGLHVVGVGYNGFTKGVMDYEAIWSTKLKYQFVEHAERNAIHNSDRIRLAGSSMYLWSNRNYPTCPECAKAIIQTGISELYLPFSIEKMNAEGLHWDIVKEMYHLAGVRVIWMPTDMTSLVAKLDEGKNP